MKTTTAALVSLVAVASLSLTACSSEGKGSGGDVDTGTALSSLRTPTGSFSKASGGSAFAGYRAKRADSSKVSTPSTGASGSSTGTRSIRLLDSAVSSSACGQGDACACPNGGSMSYKAESSSEGQAVRVQFDSCGFEDGYGFDGAAILLTSNKSLLGLAAEPEPAKAPSTPAPSGGLQPAPGSDTAPTQGPAAVLLAAKGTVSEGGKKLPLEFALLTEARYAFLAVAVPDGTIVIGVHDESTAIVRSKEGTWKCQNGSTGWTCTSEKGESIEIAEQ